MPRGDRTGPMGQGSRSGRAAGFCAGFAMPGYANESEGGRGMGQGWGLRGRGFGGGGRGFRNRFFAAGVPRGRGYGYAPQAYPEPAPIDEEQSLKSRAEALAAELDAIRERLDRLGAKENNN